MPQPETLAPAIYVSPPMKRVLVRFAILSLLAAMIAVPAVAQDKKDRKYATSEPTWQFAYRKVSGSSKSTIMNWNGTLNWDENGDTNELWLGKDGKVYRTTDKATLEAFDRIYAPMMDLNAQRGKFTDGYYEARSEFRSYERQAQRTDRQIDSLRRKLDDEKDEDDRRDLRSRIDDLQREKTNLERQRDEAAKKLEPATKKREEFYRRKEELHGKIYSQIEKLAEDAIAKGVAKRVN